MVVKGKTRVRTRVLPNVYRFLSDNYGCFIGLSRSGLV